MTSASAAPNKPFPPGSPVSPGEVIADKYRVDQLVAVGGMGIVVSARHLQLGQTVAIKVLLPSEITEGTQAIPRFLREARAAAGIRSDHVVRIYDVGTLDSGVPYMVMELLAGRDLRRTVRQSGPLSVPDAVEYVLQAADAIREAHDLGIVHRDLKPSNLFLTQRSDGLALVKVLDFGISKASNDPALAEGTLTTSRAMIGSPMYMSPEQVRDAKTVDARSDIWSLGVILHELLAGRPAFKGESLPAICAAIAADQPATLRPTRPDVPEELEAVVQKCLEKDPARRYQNVDQLIEALAPFAGRAVTYSESDPAHSAPVRPPVSVRRPAAAAFETGIETQPTQRIDRLDPSGAPVSYGALLANSDALRAAPVGMTPVSDSPFAATGMRSPASPARRAAVIGGVVAGLALLAVAVVVLRRPSGVETTAARSSAAPAEAASTFVLRVDSAPSGAEVFEGDRILGRTPLSLRIDRDSVKASPRVLVLRKEGYRPYSLEQGPSDADVEVRPSLSAEPALAEPEAGASASPGKTARPVDKPSTPKNPPGNSQKPSTDIRLQR